MPSIRQGSRLGPYEIVSHLGAGGMGEVWRARDTRLDRDVAVKILSDRFAANAQLKIRFEREAKTISQLSHPNICTLFDVGDDFLVMELLEGETLADRVARGPLPLADVLRYGAQIAEALHRAHRAGVVHRDLKPANVMLTKSGAKLLDFGLAKSATLEIAADGATMQKPLTTEGTILGTFQYMAPEQLEGLEADARTDIFALGAVLYEMVTGLRAFDGKTKTSLIAAIVGGTPKPLSDIVPASPQALEHVVAKCLAKDREDRWQSAYDVAAELRWLAEAGTAIAVAPAQRRVNLERALWAAAVIALLVLSGFLGTRGGEPRERIESSIVPPEGVTTSYVSGSIALTPDGRELAFVGRAPGGRLMLYVRRLASTAAQPLQGTENAAFPFWSPDGKFIAFGSRAKLYKVSVTGGTPELITDAPEFLGGTWNADGDIVFATSTGIHITRRGGKTDVLAAGALRGLYAPHFLPDGHRFLYTAGRNPNGNDGVFVGDVNGSPPKCVLRGVYSNVAYAPPGWIVYSSDGDIRAQRVDAKTLEASGDPIRLVDHVEYDPDLKTAMFAVSHHDSLVFVEGAGAGKSQLCWVSRDGKEIGSIAQPAMYFTPRLSHDEKRIAVDVSEERTAKGDVWIFDLGRGASSRLTYDPANESSPIWSPDDRWIYYFSEKNGRLDLYRRASGGTGVEEPVVVDAARKIPLDLSPDGRWLAYERSEGKSLDRNVDVVDLTVRRSTPLLHTPFMESALQFSPDGKWIAYESDESGELEVYAQAFPEPSGRFVISRGGGQTPQWSGDGRQIYYISSDRKLMSVAVSTAGAAFEAGTPVAICDAHVRIGLNYRQYAVARDGSKILLNRMVGDEGTRPMTLVQNWIGSMR